MFTIIDSGTNTGVYFADIRSYNMTNNNESWGQNFKFYKSPMPVTNFNFTRAHLYVENSALLDIAQAPQSPDISALTGIIFAVDQCGNYLALKSDGCTQNCLVSKCLACMP